MKAGKIIALTLFLSILVLTGLNVVWSVSGYEPRVIPKINYLPIVERANRDYEEVKTIVKTLSSLGTRYTTSQGYIIARDYILDWFNKYLTNVTVHKYNLTVLVDYGGNLTLEDGTFFKAYPLMPNVVVPVIAENVSGPLVYVGTGELNELDGNPIQGSIVIMDFNSGLNWIEVAKLGAKAVIFIEPATTNREQALEKRLERLAFKFPRFYIKREDASKILLALAQSKKLGKPLIGTLNGLTKWEMRTAENIIGFVRGTKYPNNWVVIGAYYDSLSVVPSISPGASESVSMAILLTLAKYYSEKPPDYTVMFVAFSGHHQGIWGAREFVADYVYGPVYPKDSPHYRAESIAKYVVAGFGISIIPDTPLLYPTPSGGFYIQPEEEKMPGDGINYIIDTYRLLMEQTGKDYGLEPHGTGGSQSISFAISAADTYPVQSPNYMRWVDMEALLAPNSPRCPGYLFMTSRCFDWFYYTPTDTYEAIEPLLPNVKEQMELLYSWLHTFLHTDYLTKIPANNPQQHWGLYCDIGTEGLVSNHQTYMRNYFQAVMYDETTGWYVNVAPKENQQLLLVVHTASHGTYEGLILYRDRIAFVTLANESGVAEIIGEIGSEHLDRSWQHHEMFNMYLLDSKGNVLMARDLGQYNLPQTIYWHLTGAVCRGQSNFNLRRVVLFPCAAFVLFDYIEPDYLDLSYLSFVMSVRYFIGHTPIIHHNLPRVEASERLYYDLGPNIAMAYVEPNVPLEFIIYSPYAANRPYAIFTNATKDNREGYGYTLRQGEQFIISIYDYARDLFYINEERIMRVAEPAKISGIYTELHAKSRILLEEMRAALKSYNYSVAYVKAVEAWKNEIEAYASLRSTLEDTIFTVPFFCALIIPFVFLAERLFLHYSGYKRLGAIVAIYAGLVAIFSIMHPGFTIASSAMMVLVSFAILALVIPILFIIGSQTNTLLNAIRRRELGMHVAEIGRMSFATTAFSTGIENMRKTRFRTALTLISILILSLALVLFTSVAGVQMVRKTEQSPKYTPPFEGIVVMRENFGETLEGFRYGIGIRAIQYLKAKYGSEAIIAPRIWFIATHPSRVSCGLIVCRLPQEKEPSGKPTLIRGITLLTPEEAKLTGVAQALVGNNSDWFNEQDLYACILPDIIAERLGIPKDLSPERGKYKINLCGLVLSVVGIVEDGFFDAIVDLTGFALTPIDRRVSVSPPAQLFTSETIILPAKLAPYLRQHWRNSEIVEGVMTSSVALKFLNRSANIDKAGEIFSMFRGSTSQVWVYQDKNLYTLTVSVSVKSTGMAEQSIALVLVGLTIFNLMLGSVHERKRDLFIYSSVGLSPIHISIMFIAEAAVYAVVGSLIGYVVAMTVGRAAVTLGLQLGFMNYASGWVAGAIGVSLLATILSTLYPTISAARMITPSLERRWRIPTKPVGDEWSIPLPFFPADEREAAGILNFIKEYFEHHMSPVAPEFSVSSLNIMETRVEGFPALILDAETRIVPYEQGIRQRTKIQLINRSGKWNIVIHLTRLTGTSKAWADHNRAFLTKVREQFLLWRGLPPEERRKYLKEEKK
ncbi:MAG: M28 family peptidase [Nitrososphaerota archaeon]|nr:M28 family peptidase [Candidatus Bathyarchaeota archaeon]MDW8048870.1 M28 family peptidase [Nitrososphaerota archaeon]